MSTGLSKVDVVALRKADTVCFDHGITRDGQTVHTIRAITRHLGGPYGPTGQEVTYNIEVGSRVHTYQEGESNADGAGPYEAFHMLTRYVEEWATIARTLRAGDVLDLLWIRGNDNEYLRAAGLHCDELKLVVDRGSRLDYYLIAEQVCADNRARMIRKADTA